MSAYVATSPNYDLGLVEHAILLEAIELLPARLTVAEMSLWMATNPDDRMEVETITHAIRDLRRSGLFRYRNDDQVIEPTHAALHAVALLTR